MRVFRSKVCQNNFSRSGTPKIDDFGPFQESMVEISVKCEKTCFLRPRFFRKIEEMGGYFWGCALKFFSQLWTNVESFQKKSLGSVANSWTYAAFLVFFFFSEHGISIWVLLHTSTRRCHFLINVTLQIWYSNVTFRKCGIRKMWHWNVAEIFDIQN